MHLSPIVLDLNGDGIKTLSIDAGVQFDLGATGQKVRNGWLDPNDGLLVLDRNKDGLINDGTELFGTSTILSSGEKAAQGYAALQTMDTNGDGVISNQDTGWADLQVWTDRNSDGVSQTDELAGLDSLGITQLGAQPTATSIADNGNWVGLISSFETVDGATHDMADVWFAVDAPDLRTQVNGLTQAIAAFNTGSTEICAGTSGSLYGGNQPPTEETIAATVSAMAAAMGNYSVNSNAGSQVGLSSVTLGMSRSDNEQNNPLAIPPKA